MGKKGKRNFKDIIRYILGGLIILLFLSPFIVKGIFYLHNYEFLFGLWDAKDILSYISTVLGSTIGAFVAILGILYTLENNQNMVQKQIDKSDEINKEIIRQNQEKLSEERRLSVLPYITISKILIKKQKKTYGDYPVNDEDLIDEEDVQESQMYEEDDLIDGEEYSQVIICINNDNVVLRTRLTKQQITTIKNGVNKNDRNRAFVYVPIYLINSGIGAAVDCKIHIYYKDKNTNLFKKIFIKCSPIHVLPSNKFRVCFFCEDRTYITTEYKMRIDYQDIYGNKYYQEHRFYKSKINSFAYSAKVNQKRKRKNIKVQLLKQV